MSGGRLTRRGRRYMRKILKATTIDAIQGVANDIQNDLDNRHINYDEANNLGNRLQDRVDQIDATKIVYAISDRDTYRKTLEIYLKDGLLTRTEQLLLWDERRKLRIDEEEHEHMLKLLVIQYAKQGRSVRIQTKESATG